MKIGNLQQNLYIDYEQQRICEAGYQIEAMYALYSFWEPNAPLSVNFLMFSSYWLDLFEILDMKYQKPWKWYTGWL